MEWWMWVMLVVLVVLIAAFVLLQNRQGGD